MITFIAHPGVRERHLQRRHMNPLFSPYRQLITAGELHKARTDDHTEMETFHQQFQALLERAVALKPNEQSEVILALKADLDKAYAIACGLPGDMTQLKIGLQKLITVTMNAIWLGAGDDPVAHQELTHEEEARAAHFAHLRYPLVAALVRPDSPIVAEDLIPSLLSAEPEELQASLWLFSPEQLADLICEARKLVATISDTEVAGRARQAQHMIEGFLAESGYTGK